MLAALNKMQRNNLELLHQQLNDLLTKNFRHDLENLSEIDLVPNPLCWISKWVDYSDKYGFGYQLCDDGTGVKFKDSSIFIMLSDGHNVRYIDQQGKESYFTLTSYPSELENKITLLTYFKKYMSDHLVKERANSGLDGDNFPISKVPYLLSWYRAKNVIAMHLSNGTVQFNFTDHQKIILCPLMQIVTLLDLKKNLRTYPFSSIAEHGCTDDLYQKLIKAQEILPKLIEEMSAENKKKVCVLTSRTIKE